MKQAFTHEEQIAALERSVRLVEKAADAAILRSIIVRLTPMRATKPTLEELSVMVANSGKGFTRVKLASWGVPWPTPKGWLKTLLREAREREERKFDETQSGDRIR